MKQFFEDVFIRKIYGEMMPVTIEMLLILAVFGLWCLISIGIYGIVVLF